MATLYRDYRPQNFKEVVNQNHVKITLEQEIATGKLAHAYLFSGPRGNGKTTLARVFSKAINCTKRKPGESEPCHKCEICQNINLGRSLDIIEIDAASHTGVDHVREHIIASARVTPTVCKYKVFIIDEVHMLSISAFNALLKILEEPPEYVVFILCTTEVHKVPTTIISRCQRFDFKRISINDIVKKLLYIVREEEVKIDKNILEAIARQSEGHMRDAESMLGQVVAIGGKEITREEADLVIPRSDMSEVLNLINYLSKKDAANGIQLINKLIDEGINLKQFTKDLIEVLRKIILGKLEPGLAERLGTELGEHLEIKVNEASKDLSLSQLLLFIEKFIEARSKLKGSFIVSLPIELAIIELSATEISQPKQNPNLVSSNMVDRAEMPKIVKTVGIVKGESKEIKIDDIIAKWHEVLARVKQHNHSLSFILRVCQPKQVQGNQLCLAFKYKLHKERVGDMQIKALIERVLNEVYGSPLTIEAEIDEDIKVAPTTSTNNNQEDEGMVDNLLKTFGGKVVK